MNDFEKEIVNVTGDNLYGVDVEVLQVNIGLRCNLQCRHCHHGASPQRSEMMDWPTMKLVLEAAGKVGCRLIDLTGGSPELNPQFCLFVKNLRARGHRVQVRTNLTVLLERGMEAMPEFLSNHEVGLVASLPCYLEENVCAQRGKGVFEKSIAVIQRLNRLGYGFSPALSLALVHNPLGPTLPPQQSTLEADYRRELSTRFGIEFTRLLTITNMPIGRFRLELSRGNQEGSYLRLLRRSFNPQTVAGLMCRHQLTVGWEGTLYDCDFNLALGLPVNHGAPNHVERFHTEDLLTRRIVTGEHCFGCTAGFGSSCSGALR